MRRTRSGGEGPVSLFSFQDIVTSITGIMILVVMLLVLDVINRESQKAPARRTPSSSIPDLQRRIAALEAEKKELSADIERQEAIKQSLISGDAGQLQRKIQSEEDKSLNLKQKISDLTARLAKTKQEMGTALTDNPPDKQNVQQLEEQLARIKAENRITFEFSPSPKKPILIQCSLAGIQVKILGNRPATHDFAPTVSTDAASSIAGFEKWVEGLDKKTNAFVVLVKPSAAPYAAKVIDLLRSKMFDVGYEPLEENKTAVFSDGSGA